MPTIDDLMNLRPALEENVRSYLSSRQVNAFTRRNAPEDFQLVIPRVEIKAQIGSATGRRNHCPDGQLRYDVWGFTLALQCVTSPQNVEANNLLQDEFVSLLRGFASTMAQDSLDDIANFPNHVIAEPLRDTETEENIKADNNIEYSVLVFDGKIAIRKNVWPN